MGRPLNKKYFGNRNTGSTITAADDGIGGKGLASVPVTTVGTYTTRPTISFSGTPDLLSGQSPTATVTSEAASAVVSGSTTGYVTGDLVTVTSTGGSAIARVTASAGVVSAVAFTGTGASRGSFQALTAVTTTTTTGVGTGLILTVSYQAKEVLVTDSGSGYTTTVPAATASGGGVVFGTSVMTTPVANTLPAGSGFNPEAAIIARAYTGSTVKQADIVKQVAKNRYKINTSDTNGTPIVATLKSSIATQVGDMTINATDSAGGTYWVTKLTAHKVLLFPNTGTQFLLVNGSPQSVQWTFGTPVINSTVKIDNG